ncbi:MAG: CoA transferase, partial [Myxococcales bacterium]|nr:CoA transferase [Myxococcales bacterium]
GEGQWVDVSMTDWAMAWTTPHAGNWLSGGVNPRHEALGLNGGTYYDYYRTKDGGYMSVGSLEPHFWQRLCETIERPELIPIAMSDAERVKKEIAAAFATKTRDEWAEIFAGVDACVEPVLTMEEACAHPQMVARAMVAEVPKHDGDTMKMIGTPFAFSATPCEIRRAGGPLGEHTDAALAEIGYSAEEIARMRGEGLFG